MTGEGYREGRVDVDGTGLHYRDWGDPGAPPLVLLHGLHDCADNWDMLASRLSDDYRPIALDHRGHGDSDRALPGSYGPEGYVADVEALVGELALERTVLIGHAEGGGNAIAYAAKHPGRVESLIAVDCDIDAVTANGRESDLGGAAAREWDALGPVVEHLRALQPGSDAGNLERQALRLTRELADGRRAWRSDPAVLDGRDRASLAGEWAALRCPALVVRGRQSSVVSHERAVRMREAGTRVRVAELEGGGHWLHQEIPGAFEATVRWFLRDLP